MTKIVWKSEHEDEKMIRSKMKRRWKTKQIGTKGIWIWEKIGYKNNKFGKRKEKIGK